MTEFILHPEMVLDKETRTITYKGITLNEREIASLNKLIRHEFNLKEERDERSKI